MQCTAARLSLCWHNDFQPLEQSKVHQLFPLYLGILLILSFVSTYAFIWGFTQDFGGIQNFFKNILFSWCSYQVRSFKTPFKSHI